MTKIQNHRPDKFTGQLPLYHSVSIMKQEQTGHKAKREILFKKLGSCTCQLRKYASAGMRINREKLVPIVYKSSRFIGGELKKVNRRENWFKRCGITLIDNAAGLAMALLASKIVQNTVEVKQFSNLWGLLADRPVVSESTYQILSFSAEFVISLIVFTLTEHYIAEYRQRKKTITPNENSETDPIDHKDTVWDTGSFRR